ncbi:Hypothetical predicted protein [Podarcis lilfordi]|uniref:Uncharacterized protein n=1 Tax=Podarcis lilfordi TaxID=74358 RepID=A0AA35PJL0_9SAUR|nr:Hypothetical predicted protein [Podarcis lilfordi]
MGDRGLNDPSQENQRVGLQLQCTIKIKTEIVILLGGSKRQKRRGRAFSLPPHASEPRRRASKESLRRIPRGAGGERQVPFPHSPYRLSPPLSRSPEPVAVVPYSKGNMRFAQQDNQKF